MTNIDTQETDYSVYSSTTYKKKLKIKKDVHIIKRKYIMTNIDTQKTDYSV
jgi:hypothetical protein